MSVMDNNHKNQYLIDTDNWAAWCLNTAPKTKQYIRRNVLAH